MHSNQNCFAINPIDWTKTPTAQTLGNRSSMFPLPIPIAIVFATAAAAAPAYVLAEWVCKTVSYLQGVAVSASINTMMTVTLDR